VVRADYLEMVQRITMSMPIPIRFIIQKQLEQLNYIKMPSVAEGAVLNLQGD
jgi:hypothetical protein